MKDLQGLTLREKIGQTMIMFADIDRDVSRFGSVEAMFEKYPVGGYFVGGEVIREADSFSGGIFDTIKKYKNSTKTPLIFLGDFENGVGANIKGLTEMQRLMGLGACDDLELAYNYGKVIALEARMLGIHMALAPVVDVALNFFNPLVNVRGVTDNPDYAKKILTAVICGMQENGLAATAKHFPGDGVDYRDQHIITTENTLSIEQWEKYHGGVFRHVINEGVYAVMTGHIAFPNYQKKDIMYDQFLPCTLSKELTTDLLKKDLGFHGVVVTDALMMGGFSKYFGEDKKTSGFIETFKAGSDMLLFPCFEYMDMLEEKFINNEIPIKRLDDAVSRIWKLKEIMGILDNEKEEYILSKEDKQLILDTKNKVAENCLTLVKDVNCQLPFDKSKVKKILLVYVVPSDVAFERLTSLKTEFEKIGIEVFVERNIDDSDGEFFEKYRDCDLVIYVTSASPHRPSGMLHYSGAELNSLWWSLTKMRDKSVVVSFGSPYHCNEYFKTANIYINAYTPVLETQTAFIKALFGELKFNGKSPVNLALPSLTVL